VHWKVTSGAERQHVPIRKLCWNLTNRHDLYLTTSSAQPQTGRLRPHSATSTCAGHQCRALHQANGALHLPPSPSSHSLTRSIRREGQQARLWKLVDANLSLFQCPTDSKTVDAARYHPFLIPHDTGQTNPMRTSLPVRSTARPWRLIMVAQHSLRILELAYLAALRRLHGTRWKPLIPGSSFP
jgi:hypothetical protein